MIIRENQLEKFSEIKFDGFVAKTICFLKENFESWTKDKDDEEIKKQILTMVAWAGEFEIDTELNIQKLLHYKIAFDWQLPLHEKLQQILVNYKSDQDKRVTQFCAAVEAKRYKLIEIGLDQHLKMV